MKNLITILCLSLFFISCNQCDCDYVVYENGIEIYRQDWTQHCEDQTLSGNTYYNSEGQNIHTATVIECNESFFQTLFY